MINTICRKKLFATLTLSLITLLTTTRPALGHVEGNKICMEHAESGFCQQYYLPFDSALSIQDYIDEVSKTLSEDLVAYAEELLTLPYTHKYVQDAGRDAMAYKTSKWVHKYDTKIRHTFLVVLLILREHGAVLYPTIDRTTLLHQVHTLYALLNGMTIDSAPDFTDLATGSHFSFKKFTNRNNVLNMDMRFSPKARREHLMVATALRVIRFATNAYFLYSNQNIDWLLNYAPELRTHKVIELGAGNGLLARLLRTQGVSIEATDLNPNPVSIRYDPVEKISAEQVMEKYHGSNEKIVFLITVPGWNVEYNIGQLLKIKNAILVLICEGRLQKSRFEELWPDQLHTTETILPSSFRTIYSMKDSDTYIYTFKHR